MVGGRGRGALMLEVLLWGKQVQGEEEKRLGVMAGRLFFQQTRRVI